MQTHTILIILGAVLLLAGVMGGGLTLKEMKLPSLDKSSRVLAGIVGAAFIGAGIYLESLEGEARVPLPPGPASPIAEAPRMDAKADAEADAAVKAKPRAEEEAAARARAEQDAKAKAKAEQDAKAKAKAEQDAKAKAKAEQDAKASADEEARKAELARQREKEQHEADFTRRALAAPKGNAWQGEFRMYDPADNRELATGVLQFGPTTYGENIAYARLQVETSALRQVPRGKLEADKAVWGFMGGSTDSAISFAFGKAAGNPVLVFNKVIRDRENGYLELRGVLMANQGGTNTVIAHVRASCRAR